MKQESKQIASCYDKVAEAYAQQFIDELSHKHLDRILLNAFTSENKEAGRMIDLGCGPGQTTNYLSSLGVTNLLGTDLSPVMTETAKKMNPLLSFEVADMLNLHYADQSFGSAIAFYSIVHFDLEQVKKAFTEIARVLKDKGQFLFSFHIGDTKVQVDNFLDQQVSLDFYFFTTNDIVTLLTASGFEIIDCIERSPYKDVEYASNRAYIWAEATRTIENKKRTRLPSDDF